MTVQIIGKPVTELCPEPARQLGSFVMGSEEPHSGIGEQDQPVQRTRKGVYTFLDIPPMLQDAAQEAA